MRTGARGFLLFSFAFSSVLSSKEIAVPSKGMKTKANANDIGPRINNRNSAINRDCFKEKMCGRERPDVNLEKREIRYSYFGKVGAVDGGALPAADADNRLVAEKRGTVGFTGMRGKKVSSVNDNYGDATDGGGRGFLDLLEKRTRMGFNGMRGKKDDPSDGGLQTVSYEGELVENDPRPDVPFDAFDGGWDKRTMAFHGMRGRRSEVPILLKRVPPGYASAGDYDYDLKRAMGFLGMRGKKPMEDWGALDGGKRAGQMGFFGMKGKKAQSGFFGMRGKKSSSGFLGTGGEREPSDYGVNAVNEMRLLASRERVRRAAGWLRNSKKAKNAFFAVRGKKSAGYDNEVFDQRKGRSVSWVNNVSANSNHMLNDVTDDSIHIPS